MVALHQHGIRAIDLDRGPNADDWLVLALGHDRLVPIRTDLGASNARLAVIVYADPLPSEDALTLLAQLVATGVVTRTPNTAPLAASRQWAYEAAARILAAVHPRAGSPAVIA